MNKSIHIIVLVSPATHPVSNKPIASTNDAAAFELATTLTSEENITLLCAGHVDKECLNDYLGLGARTIEVVKLDTDMDIIPALVARLHNADLILCGARSEGQFSSGLVPYLLAEALQLPLFNDITEASLQNTKLILRQFLPKGLRRRIEGALPALLTISPRAQQTRQYAFARAAKGEISYTEAQVTKSNPEEPYWKIEPNTKRPQPLKANTIQSGHSRMLDAIGGNTKAQPTAIIKEGCAEQKAAALLAYLREHRAINF